MSNDYKLKQHLLRLVSYDDSSVKIALDTKALSPTDLDSTNEEHRSGVENYILEGGEVTADFLPFLDMRAQLAAVIQNHDPSLTKVIEPFLRKALPRIKKSVRRLIATVFDSVKYKDLPDYVQKFVMKHKEEYFARYGETDIRSHFWGSGLIQEMLDELGLWNERQYLKRKEEEAAERAAKKAARKAGKPKEKRVDPVLVALLAQDAVKLEKLRLETLSPNRWEVVKEAFLNHECPYVKAHLRRLPLDLLGDDYVIAVEAAADAMHRFSDSDTSPDWVVPDGTFKELGPEAQAHIIGMRLMRADNWATQMIPKRLKYKDILHNMLLPAAIAEKKYKNIIKCVEYLQKARKIARIKDKPKDKKAIALVDGLLTILDEELNLSWSKSPCSLPDDWDEWDVTEDAYGDINVPPHTILFDLIDQAVDNPRVYGTALRHHEHFDSVMESLFGDEFHTPSLISRA